MKSLKTFSYNNNFAVKQSFHAKFCRYKYLFIKIILRGSECMRKTKSAENDNFPHYKYTWKSLFLRKAFFGTYHGINILKSVIR